MKLIRKILPIAFLCVFLMNMPAMSQVNLNNGLIGSWNFNDSTANDSSGKGHNGILNGSPKFVTGVKKTSVKLDGAADYVDLRNPTELNLDTNSDWSVSAWFKNNVISGQTSVQPIVAKTGGGSS